MFKKKFRLVRQKDFRKIFRKGRTVASPHFTLKFLKNELPYPRLGIIISAKISKKAVLRNRLKRQVREILRKLLKDLAGYDLVIIPRKSFLDEKYQKLDQEIQRLLKRSRLLRK